MIDDVHTSNQSSGTASSATVSSNRTTSMNDYMRRKEGVVEETFQGTMVDVYEYDETPVAIVNISKCPASRAIRAVKLEN